ncbi:MAG: ROK family protein [bacterium]
MVSSLLKRRQNRALLLQALRKREPVSRKTLHDLTHIRPNTVSMLVQQLLRDGIITEMGPKNGSAARGRREVLLALNDKTVVLGAEITAHRVTVGRVDFRGRLLSMTERPIRRGTRREVLSLLEEAVRIEMTGGAARGLGISVPGIVSREKGTAVQAANLKDWKHVPLRRWASQTFGLRAVVDNLTNARLYALRLFGGLGDEESFALVLLEEGEIGCGIVAEGRIVRGSVQSSSELGHSKVGLDGELCSCGGRGCLESYTRLGYLQKRWLEHLGKGRRREAPAELSKLLEDDNAASRKLAEELGAVLGLGLSNLVQLVKPRRLVLAGELVKFRRFLMPAMLASLERHSLPVFWRELKIEFGKMSHEGGAIGAACLALDEYYSAPMVAEL